MHRILLIFSLDYKGLALINGTQLITSLGAEALHRASLSARQADVIAALSIDVLQGTPRAFDQGTCMYMHTHVQMKYVQHCFKFRSCIQNTTIVDTTGPRNFFFIRELSLFQVDSHIVLGPQKLSTVLISEVSFKRGSTICTVHTCPYRTYVTIQLP